MVADYVRQSSGSEYDSRETSDEIPDSGWGQGDVAVAVDVGTMNAAAAGVGQAGVGQG